tara:strand:- start:13370 stop:14020 length:651 start_codon:yes stop_codon:yes gene_type:complete
MAKKQPNFKKLAGSIPWLSILAGIFVILLLTRMTTRSSSQKEGMGYQQTVTDQPNNARSHAQPDLSKHSRSSQQQACSVQSAVQNGASVVPNSGTGASVFARVPGGQSSNAKGLAQSCTVPPGNEPSELLPDERHVSSQYRTLEPGKLQNVPLLKAGWLKGIDTVGSTLRNANLQVRSEPPNPQVKVSPWMNSTIQPDLMRVPLEVGCGPPCNNPN